MSSDLCFAPATELALRIRRRDLSPVTLVDAYLDRIESRRDDVNAYITVRREEAREEAREAERQIQSGVVRGPLHGLPVALKDLSAAKAGTRHTFGSELFADNVAEETSAFVKRLEDAGAIVLGKANTPEFGHKPKTENGLVGPTSTPFDPDRNAGGSSGGSAAAVSDGQVALAQGGDAGGSVRIPAAFCGSYGMKPSFGRIPNPSRPDAFSSHTPFTDRGVHARTVRDAALMLSVMAGPHSRDPFSLPDDGTDYVSAVDRPTEDLRVAYSSDLGMYPVDSAVRAVVRDAVDDLSEVVGTVEEIEVDFGYSLGELMEKARHPVVDVKTTSLVENVDSAYGVDILGEDRDTFPAEFLERAERGTGYSALEYKRADIVRTDVYDTVQDIFEEYDALLTPTVSVLPFSNSVLGPTEVDGTEVDPLTEWFLTWVFNLTGHPAASAPAGFSDGLPVGIQIAGPRNADGTVLAVSGALERVRPWHDSYPPN